MSHANISIFIPHMGCPNTCSFCNQRTISSRTAAPSADEVDKTLAAAYERISDEEKRRNTEIAFFGGSFTAIDREYMTALLETAEKYICNENHSGFRGIRISTRPDCIDEEILMLLKKYGVTAIELGAQSMSDSVLQANRRGHYAADVVNAAKLIQRYGFELGLQMMVGLYKSTEADEYHTMREFLALCPDTVRIYPVAVLDGTHLAELYRNGEYQLYAFEKAVEICAELYSEFIGHNIRVIRMGLHAEDGVEQNAVAGFYHPAFGEIVRSELVKKAILSHLSRGVNTDPQPLKISASSSLIGAVYGHKGSNRKCLAERGIKAHISIDNRLSKNEISINEEVINVFKIT